MTGTCDTFKIENDVLNRQQNKPKNPTTTVPKKETVLVLPYLGVQSKIVTKTCINKFYGCIDLRVIFQSARPIKSFFPYEILSTVPKCQKLYIRLVVGTARISTLEKRNVDCMTERNAYMCLLFGNATFAWERRQCTFRE